MFKTTLTVIAIVVALTGTAQAQNFVQVETNSTAMKDGLTVNGLQSTSLSGPWGASAFYLITSGWSEVYAGPTYFGGSWGTGLSAGVSQSSNGLVPRYSALLWGAHGSLSAVAVVEFDNATFGGSDAGVWYDAKVSYATTEKFSVMAHARRFSGTGIGATFQVVKKVSVWATYMPLASESVSTQNLTLFGVKADL